ncbi:NAD(P)-dependent oxidoreductase [Solwaraspora sp. WMMD406]|uniref:NAD(P)-dependent oxidoreductase n=1 Tax=Solwaraspora sp. WMMD406 TaxID=3016095 RepID=UPI002417106A|nr:NAD(P)-dependent oxidoreductase [Solwaraspora sp. WMMD406]MDG4768319.1 NAD(P)-dependent oxidoreductase [Solwaraspora sp. WMMD406]
MRIAVLGLGAMGARMARRLLATGEDEIVVWNRTAEATRPLVEAGATAAPTPAVAAARSDLVLGMLRDDDAGRAVWLRPDTGALAAMNPGAVAIDCSTVTPSFTGELAAGCTAHGVGFLDAPVLGSRPQAEAGTLIFLAGGDPSVVRRVEPVLRRMGGAVHHMGPSGTGARMKLLVNALFAVQVAAVAEQVAALGGTDLDPARAVEVLAATPVASPAAGAAAVAMLGHTFPAAFPIDLVAKDLGYAAGSVTGRGDLPITRTAADVFQRAVEQGYGADNITGVVQLFRTAGIA